MDPSSRHGRETAGGQGDPPTGGATRARQRDVVGAFLAAAWAVFGAGVIGNA
jgi:hypothetical protein